MRLTLRPGIDPREISAYSLAALVACNDGTRPWAPGLLESGGALQKGRDEADSDSAEHTVNLFPGLPRS